MKKIIFSMLAVVLSMTAMAAPAINIAAKAQLTITAANGPYSDLYLIQSEDLNEGWNNGYCAKIMDMAEHAVCLYAIFEANTYSTFGTKVLGEMPFGVKLNSATSYTISFSKVSGTETLTLYDAVEDKYTDIVEGGSYAFTAAANQTIADRFMLKKKPAEPAICHQYGNLIITGHQGAKVKVLDMADAVAIAERTLATDDEVISLSELTKGEMYQVVMDGETMLIRIQ